MSINTCLEHSAGKQDNREREPPDQEPKKLIGLVFLFLSFCTNSRPFPLNLGCVHLSQKKAYKRENVGTGSKPYRLLREFSHTTF